MDTGQKQARKYLKEAVLNEYNQITQAAALTPLQKTLVDLHIIQGLSIIQISFREHISARNISNQLSKVYKKIYRLIKAGE